MSENPKPLPTVPPSENFFVASPVLTANLVIGPMATWCAADDGVTLDWSAIEQAAERQTTWDNGMMRGIARMLLAAREEGRRQRAVGFE